MGVLKSFHASRHRELYSSQSIYYNKYRSVKTFTISKLSPQILPLYLYTEGKFFFLSVHIYDSRGQQRVVSLIRIHSSLIIHHPTPSLSCTTLLHLHGYHINNHVHTPSLSDFPGLGKWTKMNPRGFGIPISTWMVSQAAGYNHWSCG
jgi:hypothetical protein